MISNANLQQLLDEAVAEGTAPGLLACVFDREHGIRVIAEAAAGVRNSATCEPMRLDTTVWMASKSKAVASVTALICVERYGVDMDSHEALAAVLPELSVADDQRPCNKIFDGKDELGRHRYKRARVGITLRHLLTHTSGYVGPTFSSELASLYHPLGNLPSAMSGAIAAIDTPRLFEAGTSWGYGFSTDWVGLFIERLTGLPLRKAYQELVFEPLGISPSELDTMPPHSLDGNRSAIHSRQPDGTFGVLDVPFTFFKHNSPQGFATLASGPLHGTLRGFAKFACCILNKLQPAEGSAPPLISSTVYNKAMDDGLRLFSLSLPQPTLLKSVQPHRARSVLGQYYPYATSSDASKGEGWSLMQAVYARAQTANGHAAGTIAWSGLANSFYFIDPQRGIGAVLIAQVFPWMDPALRDLRDKFERWIYDSLSM